MKPISRQQMLKVRRRLKKIYGEAQDINRMEERLFRMIGRYGVGLNNESTGPILITQDIQRWDHSDTVLITYADMVQEPGRAPLQTLRSFAEQELKSAIKTVRRRCGRSRILPTSG